MQKIIDAVGKLRVGEVQSHRNLAIAPLLGSDSSLDYLVLSDAIKRGFEIKERPGDSGGPSVPELFVSNKTGKNVLAIAGEYVVGGLQNRTFTRNIYFDEAFEGEIPVTCIEAGRWHPARVVEEEPEEEAPSRPQREREPVFEPSGVVPGYYARASQQETWRGAESMLAEISVSSETSDLSSVYRTRERDFREFREHFSVSEGQVGMVSVVSKEGKKSYAADIFDRASTLQKYFNNLVESYILGGGLESKEKIEVSEDEARGFLDSVEFCDFRNLKPISLGEDVEMSRENLLGFALMYQGTLVYANLFTPDDRTPGEESGRGFSTGFGRETF